MSDFKANTDVMRSSAEASLQGANTLSQTANRLSGLNSQLGNNYQGQLRDKVGPIISGVIRDSMRLSSRSKEFGTSLNMLAADIDKVMQQSKGAATSALTTSAASESSIVKFFGRINQAVWSAATAIMTWVGLGRKAVPVTTIPINPSIPSIETPIDNRPSPEQERQARGTALVKQYDGSSYAEGTYISRDSYSARPVNPPVTNAEGDRDPNIYNSALNQFGVEVNPRYDSRNNNTYCNIYVWDATRAMGAEIPHWVDPNGRPVDVGQGRELNANGVVKWLSDHGNDYGWHAVTAEQAQEYANKGSPAVVVWANPNAGESGHVAMVRPGEYSSSQGPAIAQAGAHNYNDSRVSKTFGDRKVVYYVHD